jgi:hypothetical protein
MTLPATDAAYAINVISGARGLTVRPGWEEVETNLGGHEVRSLLPYHGSTPAADRLFASTSDYLYDTSGDAQVALWSTVDATSGTGAHTVFTNGAGRWMAYTDEANGYYIYEEATDTWSVGSVTGPPVSDLVFVVSFKHRLWFVERGSSRAWYLGLDAISGALTQFDFGPLFPHGGSLIGLYTWTMDGGIGADDMFVACSTAGDVVVFRGTDPASAATWEQLGEFFVGGFPAGRRVAANSAGDILLLTVQGALPLSKLVLGQALTPETYETRRVRPLFTEAMATMRAFPGWEMQIHPEANFLMINTPGNAAVGEIQKQFAMSYATRGWSRLVGLDILCTGVWRGKLYFGTRDGRVCLNEGPLDGVELGGVTTNATAIECAVLSAFRLFGTSKLKTVRHVIPTFITKGRVPDTDAFARFDYDVLEPVGSIPASMFGPGLWDTGLWDSALWAGALVPVLTVSGAEGEGRAIAVGCHFFSQDYTVLVGFMLAWEEGGLL